MRMVRAILIDPFEKTVTEVQHDADDYRGIYKLISHETMPVDCFTVVRLDDVDSVFIDDEGLLKDPTHFFLWRGYPQPLAGKGLILGCDEEGETIACAMTLEQAKANIGFTDQIRLSHFEDFEHDEEHEVFGKMHVIGHRPVFTSKED